MFSFYPSRRLSLSLCVALGLVVTATLIRLWFLESMGLRATYITFYPAVTIAALYGGFPAGVLATLLSGLSASYFWIEPAGNPLIIEHPGDQLAMAVFLFNGLLISYAARAMHHAQVKRKEAEAQAALAEERRRSEEQLRETAQRLNAHLANSPLAVVEFDPDFRIIRWSDGAKRLFGWEAMEVIGKALFEMRWIYEEDTQIVRGITEDMLAGHRPRNTNGNRNYCKDGSVIDCQWYNSAIYDREGKLSSILSLVLGITEQKQAQRELTRRQALLDAVCLGTTDAIFVKDRQGRMLLANPATLQAIGRPAEDVLGHTDNDFYGDPQASSTIMENDRRVMESGEDEVVEEHVPTPEGMRIFLSSKAPWFDEHGQVIGLIGVARDITERKKMEQELAAVTLSAQRAKLAAEQASQAKDHFLAVLSHELRTPLTPVLATVSMLIEDDRLDAALKDQIEVIQRNVELEARLIDDLLDITRISRGKVELEKRPVELGQIIQHALEVCRADIEGRGLHLEVDIRSNGRVEADAARLQQVFWNLLRNSAKFTPQGGRVSIRCWSPDLNRVIVEVSDTGVGIEPQVLPLIFNVFEQGDRNVTRRFGGLGLGLTISRAMVELHGGSIEATSEGREKGATFRVTLPLMVDQTARGYPTGKKPDSENAAPSRPLRILLVEDHGDSAVVMTRLLRQFGHEVHAAGDVATALKLSESQPFDLMLSDLGLPDGSGLDLMRTLRARGVTFPGVALSGYGQEQDVRQSREAGFKAHLTKPVNFHRITEIINEISPSRA